MSQPMPTNASPVSARRRLWLKLLLAGLGILLIAGCLVSVPCLTEARDDGARGYTVSNLKQISLSFFNYYDVHQSFPPASMKSQNGGPLLSWRVAILPFIEQDNLYKEFHLNEPWDSPHNIKLLGKMPRTYRSEWGRESAAEMTRFQVLIGPGTAFEHDGMTFSDFPNGLGNTIFVAHAAQAIPWTKPEDLIYKPSDPIPQFMIHYRQHRFWCHHFGKIPSYLFGMGDGSIKLLRADMPESTIRALITRDGGEKVDASGLE